MSDEQTKAVTAVADATGKLADLASKAGSFCARLVGQAPEQIGGIATDWATYLRCSNLLIIQDMVEAKLKKRALQGKPVPIKLRLAYPMLEAASLEDDETLQTLWANLIANATDPNYSAPIHPAFIDVIKQLSSDEALILQYLVALPTFPISYMQKPARFVQRAEVCDRYLIAVSLKRRDLVLTYLDNLERLQILHERQVISELGQEVEITAFGKSFVKATLDIKP